MLYPINMSRACSPGGRFTSDFEQKSMFEGIDADLKNPVGTHALWYLYDAVHTAVDPIYDVGDNVANLATHGRIWKGPFPIPIIRAVLTQGNTKLAQAGFYNASTLHLTLNANDIEAIAPGVMFNPSDQNRSRVVWKNEVFRPFNAQQRGIINEDYTLLVIECQQVMPEEMVNDPQFLTFSDNPI